MKKLVLLLTVILIAFCLTSCGEEKTAKGFDYTVNSDGKTCTITGIDSSLPEWLEWLEDIDLVYEDRNYSSNLTIPKYLNGYSVTSIGNYAFENCDSLTFVTIPDSVTSIGNYAFENCDSLTSVTIPDSVTSIGYGAFSYCKSLTSVTIPDSVTSIGEDAFWSCNSLTSIVVDKNNQYYKSIDGNLYSKDGSTLIQYAVGKSDTNFTIPDSVTSIGDSAFSYCYSLTSVTIPDGVTSIGNWAFSNCNSLTSVTIPDSVTSIDDYAFYSCDSLASVTIPDSVTSIGNSAFSDCNSLTSVTIPDSVTSIGSSAFSYCDSLTSVTIPDSVTSIGSSAFENCYNLYIIYNNSNLNFTIGDESYGGVAKNAKIIVNKDGVSYANDGNKYILTDDGFLFRYKQGEYTLIAYDGRESKVTLPKKINGSSYSLENVKGLTEVVIPDGVTSIKDNSFADNLRSITIPASVISIDADTFKNFTKLESIYVSEENTAYKSIDGNLYTKDGKTLIKYARCKGDKQFIVPNEMVEIIVTYPYDLYYIESVVIHDGVTNIADSAFSKCEKLEYVYFTGTQEEWKNILIGKDNGYLIDAIIVYEYIPE